MAREKWKLNRLLMTADAVGGVWQYAVDLASAFARSGTEVLLATLGPRPSREQLRSLENVSGVETVHGDFALEWAGDPWLDVDRSTEWLLDLERSFAPDIVHLNGYSQAAAAWSAAVICVAHSCVFSWWQAVHGCAPPPEWSEYHKRVTRGLYAACAIIAPSCFMAESLGVHYSVPREKIQVIHNFSAMAPGMNVQKEQLMLAAGRVWDKAKNIALLTRIASDLSWPLHVAGDSESFERGPVKWLGRLLHEDVLAQMARASVFVHPALYEPFGLAVLEAAQAGCCLVLADIPSLRELWDGAAIFVDPHDTNAWTRDLNRIIADGAERERLAALAISNAEKYSRDRAQSAYEGVYAAALCKRPSRDGVAA